MKSKLSSFIKVHPPAIGALSERGAGNFDQISEGRKAVGGIENFGFGSSHAIRFPQVSHGTGPHSGIRHLGLRTPKVQWPSTVLLHAKWLVIFSRCW